MPATKAPLWDLIDKDFYHSEKKFYCIYCQVPVDSNISRFRNHATRCSKIPLAEKIRCIKGFNPAVNISTDPSPFDEDSANFLSPSSSVSTFASQFQSTSSEATPIKQSRKRASGDLITSFMDRMDNQTQEKASRQLAKFFLKTRYLSTSSRMNILLSFVRHCGHHLLFLI